MKGKREKGYWVKKHERFASAEAARARAGALRLHEHTSHVTVQAVEGGFEVHFSVAKWYAEELERAGGKL